MDSGEIGIISAIVTVLTLLISKLVEFWSARMKVHSEYKLKNRELTMKDYDELKAELKLEVENLRNEVDILRDENIVLQVEKARMEIISEHLRAEVVRLTESHTALEAELTRLRAN